MATPLEQAELAVDALYSSPNPATAAEASAWLDSFQHSPEAWSVSWGLIQSSNVTRQYFGALTLHSKVRRDWGTLDVQSRAAVRVAVVDLVAKAADAHAGGTLSDAVFTKIALILCSLAVHTVPVEWSGMFEELVGKWGPSSGSVRALTEFLRLLPEELGDMDITQKRRDDVRAEMMRHVEPVLRLCATLQDTQLGFRTALSWIVFSPVLRFMDPVLAGDGTEGTGVLGACFHVVEATLRRVDGVVPPTFTAAVDLLETVLRRPINVAVHMDAIAAAARHVLGLVQTHTGAGARVAVCEELGRGVPAVAAAFGRGQVAFLAGGSDEAVALVSFLTDCARDADMDVADDAFGVLSELYVRLRGANSGMAPRYGTLAAQLVISLVERAAVPDDIDSVEDMETADQFIAFRSRLADTLRSAAALLGPAASLELLQGLLVSAVESGRWKPVEAVMEGFRAISDFSADVLDTPVLPRLFSLLQHLPGHPLVRRGALRLAAAYAPWIGSHNEHVFHVAQYALSTLASTAPGTPHAAAASALADVCRSSAPLLAPHFEEMCSVLRFPLSTQSKATAVGALAVVATYMTHGDHVLQALCALQQGPLAAIGACVAESKGAETESYGAQRVIMSVAAELSVLAAVFPQHFNRTPVSEGAHVEAMRQAWPTLRDVVGVWAQSSEVIESLCGVVLAFLGAAGKAAWPVLADVLNVCVACAATPEPHPAALKPIAVAVAQFGTEPGAAESGVTAAAAAACRAVSAGLRSQSTTVASRPDVVCAYFDTLNAVVNAAPHALSGGPVSALVPEALQLAMDVIRDSADVVTIRSVANFCLNVTDPDSLCDGALLKQAVPALAGTVLLAAATVSPRGVHTKIADMLFACFERDGRGATDACAAALAAIPSVADERARIVGILAHSSAPPGLSRARAKRKYRVVVSDVVLVCSSQLMPDVLVSHEM